MPQRFDKAAREEWLARGKQADIFSEPAQHNLDRLLPRPDKESPMMQCVNCGAPLAPFVLEHRLNCPHCGGKQDRASSQHTFVPILPDQLMVRSADVSMPPEGSPVQPKETALPYNPGAYEGMVEDMHPAAQYTYQRAVANGAAPQAAMAAAQEKQGEMMKRNQEGQNIEGVQIPVISSTDHDRPGFVSAATIKRVSHLVS